MPHPYTEDQLVEQPAIQLFSKLGWKTAYALEEVFGPRGTLQRESPGEAVLVARLRAALERLNPDLPREALSTAIDDLTRDRSTMSMAAANREVYGLLKEGIRVSVADTEPSPVPSGHPLPLGEGRGEGSRRSGGQRTVCVRVIDWEHPVANDFLLVSQFSVTGALYTRRPDLVGFVNGLPLVVIELKKPGVAAKQAFDDNLTCYKADIPQLFWTNALFIAYNGTESRVGSLTADWERFFEWKRIARQEEPGQVSLETMIRGTCEPARLLDLVENFTLFSEHTTGLVKVIGQNHQYLGVNSAVASMLSAREAGHGRGGVFWQTQGSGKSFAMVFFSQKVLRKVPGNWTFVVVTDRVELDDQIAKTFKACGAISEAEGQVCHATSGAHLRELLGGNHRYVFTLIHKFRPENSRAETPSPAPSGHPLPGGEGHFRGGLSFSGLVNRARELRQQNTPAEAFVWELLRDRRFFGFKFRRQHQIGNYIADFICDERKLVLELDGEVHQTPEVAAKDATRDATLRSLGFAVIRFPNQLIVDETEQFIRQISSALDLPSTLGRGAGGEGDDGVMPVLCDRRDIVVLTDEAHRSQYDTLALNMRAALPRATFLAFTGTPLIAGEERTREVFGEYVSIYDFQQSVEDHATVPLYYENRTPELKLDNPDLNEDLYTLIEDAQLDEAQEQKLERELGRQYHLITRDDRLETIAKDIVRHFLGRGFQGKAMVISIDKATAHRMHDKVKRHWEAERQRVEEELDRQMRYGEKADPVLVSDLIQRLEIIKTTDMALIVSSGQNETAQMATLGLNIAPHRKRMNDEALDEKFKDPKDPLRIVFLCAMWLTGFDAPSCSTVYLDKPMRNHTLMQTIARANRVFPGKHSGMIVDYANVFASLERALAIYGAGQGGTTPVRDKAQLVQELRQAIEGAVTFCGEHGVDIDRIDGAKGLAKLTAIGFAVNALIAPDPLRKEFLAHDRLVQTLDDAVKPDPVVLEFRARVACIGTIADAIRAKINPGPADISGILASVNALLDESISSEGFTIKKGGASEQAPIDLSEIDFEALAKRFKNSKIKNIDLERLKAAIRAKLGRLIRLNRTRADYQEKFEQLIEAYNSGSRNIDDLFKELLELSQSLTEEEQRHVREHLSEEELTIFDLLTRPGPDLTLQERDEVKKVAQDLLGRFKAILSLDWRRRAQARAQVRLAIEDVLDAGLPRAYTPELYQAKAGLIFEHLYESYPNRGVGVYAE